MKLQNKILRFVISAGVIVLTSSFLTYELVSTHKEMSEYMRYIINKGESNFLYERYQNQLIIAQFSRKLGATPSAQAAAQACDSVQQNRYTHGLNISQHPYAPLHGTLNAGNTPCQTWVNDLPALQAFDMAIENHETWTPMLPGSFKPAKRFRYYIDLINNYVYFNTPVEITDPSLTSWSFLQSGRLGISQDNLNRLFQGRTVISSIYKDTFSHKNILTFLTPVYLRDTLKGVMMVDVSRDDMRKMFYSTDRPNVWRYLDLTLTDSDSGTQITVHRSGVHLFRYAHGSQSIGENIHINLSLDVMYFLLSSWKLFFFYLLSTAALLHLVRTQFRLFHSINKENISDEMTGLYNRKILSPMQSMRMQRLTEQGVGIVVIAIDCDKLKQINDTWGHDEGDRVITMLAQAISATIRRSDYGVRLGGDEFCIILVDYEEAEAQVITERIQDHLALIDTENRVSFSWGAYKMRPGDSLNEAMKIADQRLYQHKNQRNRAR